MCNFMVLDGGLFFTIWFFSFLDGVLEYIYCVGTMLDALYWSEKEMFCWNIFIYPNNLTSSSIKLQCTELGFVLF